MIIAKERIEYWALLAEVAGAVGVIVSVIYLAIQVGASTTEMQAQTHYNALRLAQQSVEMQVANMEIADLVTRGSGTADDLSPTEWQSSYSDGFRAYVDDIFGTVSERPTTSIRKAKD